MDLFSPTRITSLGGKRYGFIIIDDFSRFTWILFLVSKNEAFLALSKFYRKISNENGLPIISIHNDHGTEFENKDLEKFCDEKGIDHNFSAPRTL